MGAELDRLRTWLRHTVGAHDKVETELMTVVHLLPGGFTSLSEDLDAATRSLFAFEATRSALFEGHGGKIVQVLNGQIAAVFADAVAAVRASREVVEAGWELAGATIPLTCAIHAGPIAAYRGRRYGSPFNTAGRVAALAAQLDVRVAVSGTAAGLVEQALANDRVLVLIDEFRLRGRERPLEVFKVAEQSEVHRQDCSVFISYRRDGGSETARLIAEDLRRRGVDTFLDIDNLGAHYFDDRIHTEIAGRRNFVLVLSSGALTGCFDESDWLRREIIQALETESNIVPVLKGGFSFREAGDLPPDLADLPRYNCVRYSHEYFHAAMERLMEFLVADDSARR